jgi:RNA polymerase sigma-70 factor (ECF subfamily)
VTDREETSGDRDLQTRLRAGDTSALAEVFSRHRERLGRLVQFRLSARIAGRIDVEDVLQESYLQAASRVHHFVDRAPGSLFVWVRLMVLQTLTDLHRAHLGAQARDAKREVALPAGGPLDSTSLSVAHCLLGRLTSPSQAAVRAELAMRLQEALELMPAMDREVLALRHFEELSNPETAEVLGIEPRAASARYLKALERLKNIMVDLKSALGSDA